jgi:hypothetical protein
MITNLPSKYQYLVNEIKNFEEANLTNRVENIILMLKEETFIEPEGTSVGDGPVPELVKSYTEKITILVLADMAGFNTFTDEDIYRLIQFEYELFNSIDKLMSYQRRDTVLLEDLTFLSSIFYKLNDVTDIDVSRSLAEYRTMSETFNREDSEQDHNKFVEEMKIHLLDFKVRNTKIVQEMFEHKSVEMLSRVRSIEELYPIEEPGVNIAYVNLAIKELEDLMVKALGYSNVYSLRMKYLNGILLNVVANLINGDSVYPISINFEKTFLG